MLPKTKSGVQAFAAWAPDFLSFLTKKSGYGFLPSPEAIAGAGSRSGAYVGSVRQRNLRTKRNSLHDAKQEELHSAGAVRAKPFRRANCFRPHNLSSKGCNNEHSCLLFATPRQKKRPGRGEAHSRARHRFLIGNRFVAMPQSKRQISCRFSSLKKMLNHYRCPTKDSANQHPNPWQ